MIGQRVINNILVTKPIMPKFDKKSKNNTRTYKGHNYYKDADGLWKVEKDGSVFVVALDDSKMSGNRSVNMQYNNEESAKRYIDWVVD